MSEIKDISEEMKLNPVSALSVEDIAEIDPDSSDTDKTKKVDPELEEGQEVETIKFTLAPFCGHH